MKFIIAYIQPERTERILNALGRCPIRGLSLSDVKGFGQEHDPAHPDYREYFGTEMTRKVRLEIACHDDEADSILDAIYKAAHTGQRGDGKAFVLPLLDALRLKTGERGAEALGSSSDT